MTELLGLPPNHAAHGAAIDYTMLLIHILMLVLFVGWGAFFAVVLIRFRSGKNPRANYAGVKSRMSTYVEVTVALIEVVLLIGFAIPLWSDRVDDFPDEKDAIVVQVTGEQFAWNIHYPGPDGVFGNTDLSLLNAETNPLGLDRDGPGADDIVTLNQLHLPVDKPAIIHLRSKDVIHCFSLPYMRIKQDTIPGMDIPVWFVPTQTGNSEIACAQLCGLGHYRMKGFLTVETQDEFDAWLQEQADLLAEESAEEDFWND